MISISMLYFLKGLSITHMDDTGDSDDGNTFITRMFIRHGLHTLYCAGCVCLSFPAGTAGNIHSRIMYMRL